MPPFDNQLWQEFVNNSATQVPAYGIVRATGLSTIEAGRVVLIDGQDDAPGFDRREAGGADDAVRRDLGGAVIDEFLPELVVERGHGGKSERRQTKHECLRKDQSQKIKNGARPLCFVFCVSLDIRILVF